MALATASKGSFTIGEYFAKMKGLADEMVSAGKKIEDEELASYILTRLDEPFDPVVSAVVARVEPISMSELYTQLVSFKQCMDLRGGGHQSSSNMATRGGRGGGNNTCGRGGGRGEGRGQRGGRGGGGGRTQGGAPQASSASSAARKDTPSFAASKGLTLPLLGLHRRALPQRQVRMALIRTGIWTPELRTTLPGN